MHVIARKRLKAFWERHADAAGPLQAWHQEAEQADWANTAQVKQQFPKASIISDSRVVFDIKGNDYRLVVDIWYEGRTVYVKFIGTHAEYDRIDAETVNHG